MGRIKGHNKGYWEAGLTPGPEGQGGRTLQESWSELELGGETQTGNTPRVGQFPLMGASSLLLPFYLCNSSRWLSSARTQWQGSIKVSLLASEHDREGWRVGGEGPVVVWGGENQAWHSTNRLIMRKNRAPPAPFPILLSETASTSYSSFCLCL